MKALVRFAGDFLLCAFGSVAILASFAEIERQDAAALRAMVKQRQVEMRSTKWRELDEQGRRLTNYDQIGTAKWAR